jgi:RNA polymerase sigma factor (sigma-70 family)
MSDSFSQYLTEAARYPLLNKTQEIMLARQVQIWLNDENATARQKVVGRRAYEKLINCNLRLVVSVSKKFAGRMKRSDIADLVQEGNIGLAHGIKKFDPERGYALSTYVYWWIRQAVSRYLSCSDRVIRMPSHASEILAKVKRWTPEFVEAHGRIPTIEECATYCKTSAARLQLYLDNGHDALSLDSKCKGTEGDTALVDVITDGVCMMDSLEYAVREDFVEAMLDKLGDTDRQIVIRSYGLDGLEPRTLQKIGSELGISRERVRQRLLRATNRMQVIAQRMPML